MAFEMTASQFTTLRVTFLDSKGNPAKVDGTPLWQIDNPNVIALQPALDGMSCKATALGPLASGMVTLRADADMGSGVEEIVGTWEYSVVAGEATTVQITADPASEQS